MLLHLGQERSVRLESVVAILDYALFKKANAQFLQAARSEGRLEVAGPPAETVIIAGGRVILTHLSRQTLGRRARIGLPRGVRRTNRKGRLERRGRDHAPGSEQGPRQSPGRSPGR